MDTGKLEQNYLNLYWQWHRCQWENYFDDARHDLSAIDREIYSLLSPYQNVFKGNSRREIVLNAVTQRALIEKNPDVTRLRNKLDDETNYISTSESPVSGDGALYSQVLGARMQPDVLTLMQIRQSLARKFGFDSYPDFACSVEELPFAVVQNVLHNHIEQNLPIAKTLVQKYDMKWSSWFVDLERIGEKRANTDQVAMVNDLLRILGFERLSDSIKVIIKEPTFPYAAYFAPDDIRLMNRPIACFDDEITLFHELGHVISYALNNETGIFQTWTNVADEMMGVVFERIAAEIYFDEQEQAAAKEKWLLEDTRCATSALFELAMWQHPEAAETLYTKYYGEWGIEPMASIVWANDSFRSIDPIYIQNYVIGRRIADRTVTLLKSTFGTDFKAWGRWLTEKYYADGSRRSLVEKVAIVGGLN